jgi:hypothetical protein
VLEAEKPPRAGRRVKRKHAGAMAKIGRIEGGERPDGRDGRLGHARGEVEEGEIGRENGGGHGETLGFSLFHHRPKFVVRGGFLAE